MTKAESEKTSDATESGEGDASGSGSSLSPWGRDLPQWFRRWPDVFGERWPEWMSGDMPTMRIEQFNEGDALVIRGEIPDVDPETDIEITVDNGRLDIAATREERSETKEKDRYHSEFRYGAYHRSIALPAGASEDDIEASYRDGILEVRVPVKPGAEGATKIQVTR